jgi:hypothetical protein
MQSQGPAPLPATELNERATAPAPLDGGATPQTADAAVPASAIIALSDDPLLLAALEGAARAHAAVIISPSADRFVDQLVANAASIALIDASSAPTPLKGFIALLREQFPHLLLILAGPAQLQHQFAAQIGEGNIFRFVHKPASSQRLKLFIDAALRRQQPADAPIPALQTEIGMGAAYGAIAPPRARGTGLGLAIVLGVALIAMAVLWSVSGRTPPAPALAPSPVLPAVQPPSPAVAAPAAVDSSDALAQSALRERLAAEARERDAAALARALATASDARADQLSVYVQLARRRLASGTLIDPADDSARAYLDFARALAPDDAQVRATSIALGEALISKLRHALSAGNAEAAQRWLQACSDYKVNPATLAELTTQLSQLQSPAPAVEATPPQAAPAALP